MGFYQTMIPRYAEWTSLMTDLLKKTKKFEWGPDQALGLAKLKKTFFHQQTINNARPGKINKIVNRCFRQNNRSNNVSAKETFRLLFKEIDTF